MSRSSLPLLGALLLPGCAVIAGYDFGKYTEAGSGGKASTSVGSSSVSGTTTTASHTSSSGMGGASTVTSSSSVGGSLASASVSVSASVSSTSGLGGASSSSVSASWASSSTASATVSTSSSASSSSGTMVTLFAGKLSGPDLLVVDSTQIYFTTNSGPANQATNGFWTYNFKTSAATQEQSGVPAATAIALGATGTGAYYAMTDLSSTGQLWQSGSTSTPLFNGVAGVAILGVATLGATIYFTTADHDLWESKAGSSNTFGVSNAAGPVATDHQALYFATQQAEIKRYDGNNFTTLVSGVVNPINQIVSDGQGFVYWTDTDGAVSRASNAVTGTPTPVAPGNASPAYGIAVDSTGNVYFARDTQIWVSSFPSYTPKVLLGNLAAPHGVFLSGTMLYIADFGAGQILALTVS